MSTRTVSQASRSAQARLRRASRRAVSRAAPHGRALSLSARQALPQPVRSQLYRVLPWRPVLREVPIDALLLGTQNRTSATDFAAQTGDLLWPSTRVIDGPHAGLLRLAASGPLSDAEILATDYAELGRQCIALRGCFFWATDEAGIVEVTRDYIARHGGAQVPAPRAHQSVVGSAIEVAPVRGSDVYQVIDGHHRAASAALRGAATVEVRVKWLPVSTPLQDVLSQMSWLQGSRELYQPIVSPDLVKSWTTVRACTDRLAKMKSFLRARSVDAGSGTTYLDVASCYGWFVAQMAAGGYDAQGVERDPLAVPLGRAVYGLAPGQITTGDAVDHLSQGRTWDVVSCFSLLHHFVLGRGAVGAEDLARLLDRATGRVLFLDTGQEHEQWFSESLRGWDAAAVRAFLLRHTTFDEVVDLGPDEDAVPPYHDNYGRHLFACVRSS
jgi:hypothetical protein